jgi:hypothetical protein
MRKPVRYATCILVGSLAAVMHLAVQAQNPPAPSLPPTYIPDIHFSSGRNIAPYFEGWIKNPDETFDFVFGYLNRNYEQDLVIQAGPDNSVMPGGPDRGQPTFFHPRRESRVFRVRVPKDWGKDQRLTWTITANGQTEKAAGQLLPLMEINEHMMLSGGNNTVPFGEVDPNTAPAISLAPVTPVKATEPVMLTAKVADDGLPKPRPIVEPKVPTGDDGRFKSQRNSTGGGRGNVGLRVNWLQYRGPAKVTFDTNPISVVNGQAVTTARFPVPGTYVLVAAANDGRLANRTEITVTVTP